MQGYKYTSSGYNCIIVTLARFLITERPAKLKRSVLLKERSSYRESSPLETIKYQQQKLINRERARQFEK